MNDGEIKREILRFLAKVRKEEGPDKRSNLTNLANDLGTSIDELNSKYLTD